MARLRSARAALAILTSLNLLNYVDRYWPAERCRRSAEDLHLKDSRLGSAIHGADPDLRAGVAHRGLARRPARAPAHRGGGRPGLERGDVRLGLRADAGGLSGHARAGRRRRGELRRGHAAGALGLLPAPSARARSRCSTPRSRSGRRSGSHGRRPRPAPGLAARVLHRGRPGRGCWRFCCCSCEIRRAARSDAAGSRPRPSCRRGTGWRSCSRAPASSTTTPPRPSTPSRWAGSRRSCRRSSSASVTCRWTRRA